jgi:phosphatidylglycerophosphatase A
MGLVLLIVLKPDDFWLFIIFIMFFLIGIITSDKTEKIIGKDSRHIVIDEFCGYLLAVMFIPRSLDYLVAGLVLFRVFDIMKPPPIRKIEEIITGGKGVMLDDVLAAVYSNLCLQLWRIIMS